MARQEVTEGNSSLVPEAERHPRRYALLSVSDKTGIVDLARGLDALGFTISSTGGTGRTLREEGINIVPIEEITGYPEAFDGRMKTISFQVGSGILFNRQNPQHIEQARLLDVHQIDVVVCNLYPFEKTIRKPYVSEDEAIENIDVGGPTMIRAAAKNFKNVLVLIDPRDYDRVIEALRTGNDTLELRKQLAAKAFHHISLYDSQIARYITGSSI